MAYPLKHTLVSEMHALNTQAQTFNLLQWHLKGRGLQGELVLGGWMRWRAGWLEVWGKQHLGVQRACLMCSLALAAPPGKAADDKLSGEVSSSCSISLPQSLTLFVHFTMSSCPWQPCTLPVTLSSHWLSLPGLRLSWLNLFSHPLLSDTYSFQYKQQVYKIEQQYFITPKCNFCIILLSYEQCVGRIFLCVCLRLIIC